LFFLFYYNKTYIECIPYENTIRKDLSSKIKNSRIKISKKDIARGILWIGLGILLSGCSPKKETHTNIFTGEKQERINIENIYSKENRIDFSDMYVSGGEEERYIGDRNKSIRDILGEDTKYTHPYNLERVLSNTLKQGKNAIVQTYSSEYNSLDKKAALITTHIQNMNLLDKKFPEDFEVIGCKIRNKEDLKYLNEKHDKGYEKNPSIEFYDVYSLASKNPFMGIEGVPENRKEMNKLLYGIKGMLNSGFEFVKGKYDLKE